MRPARATGRVGGQQLVDLDGQPLPVGQPGEPVVVGVVADLGEQLLVADGGVDVGQHRVQRGAVAVGEGDDDALPVAHLQVARLACGGRQRSGEQLGDPAAGQRRLLLLVGLAGGHQERTVGDRGPAAERVVGVPRTVVPGVTALGGDHEPGRLVQVGGQPQRHPLGVEQLAQRLDDLHGAGLVGGHLLHAAGEPVDALERLALAGDGGEAPVHQHEGDGERGDEQPGPGRGVHEQQDRQPGEDRRPAR